VRINPHVMAGGNLNISTGHIDSKFGISIYQMRHVERIVSSTGLVVNGLHMHTGSDILDVEVFFEVRKFCLSKHSFSKTFNLSILALDFKVPYKPDDYATDIEELGQKLGSRFQRVLQIVWT
jgi:diaminopimelate decarboxylase